MQALFRTRSGPPPYHRTSAATVGNQRATVFACLSRSRGPPICDRLPSVATCSGLIVASPFVGRVGSDPAFAGNSLVQTVQDSTVVCTVPELQGRSDFHIYYSRTTPGKSPGPSTYPATLDVFNGKTPLAWILSATFQNQQKGVFVDQKRCRRVSTFVPLTDAGLPGPPDPRRLESPRFRGVHRRSLARDSEAGRVRLPQPHRVRRPVHEPWVRSSAIGPECLATPGRTFASDHKNDQRYIFRAHEVAPPMPRRDCACITHRRSWLDPSAERKLEASPPDPRRRVASPRRNVHKDRPQKGHR